MTDAHDSHSECAEFRWQIQGFGKRKYSVSFPHPALTTVSESHWRCDFLLNAPPPSIHPQLISRNCNCIIMLRHPEVFDGPPERSSRGFPHCQAAVHQQGPKFPDGVPVQEPWDGVSLLHHLRNACARKLPHVRTRTLQLHQNNDINMVHYLCHQAHHSFWKMTLTRWSY